MTKLSTLSCSENQETDAFESETPVSSDTTELSSDENAETTEALLDDLPDDINLEGMTFTFIVEEEDAGDTWSTLSIYAEEERAEIESQLVQSINSDTDEYVLSVHISTVSVCR